MATPKPILHLPLIAGACAASYALSLAFVTTQQARADARVAAAHEPMQEALGAAARQRRNTAVAVGRAGSLLEEAADAYHRALDASSSLDGTLALLAGRIESVTGAAAALPDRVSLPAPQVQVVQVAAPPPVQATTGGSGG